MRLVRALAFGIGLSALGVAAGLSAPAQAASAQLSGAAMPEGYGRISLTFDEATPTTIRIASNVLIVSFATPVRVDVRKIAAELPDYVSIARVDPDGRGMRLALARPYKANLIEAGDRAFIDLVPENWTGLLPGPPPEVVAALAERLRLAEARARQAAGRPAPMPALTLRAAGLPTLDRLSFTVPTGVTLRHELDAERLKLTFDRPLAVDAAELARDLPEGMRLGAAETEAETTKLSFIVPAGRELRASQEGGEIVVDLVKPSQPQGPLAALQALAESSKAAPATGPSQPAAPAATEASKPATIAEKPTAKPAAATPAPDPTPRPVTISADKDGTGIAFAFPRPTGAAAFASPGSVTLVFDTRDIIDPAALKGLLPGLVQDTTFGREGKATRIDFRLARDELVRLSDDGNTWRLGFGARPVTAADPVTPRRAVDETGQTVIAAPLPGMTGIHWLEKGPAGLPVAVATATGPARSVVKPYRHVEFSLLPTAHGVAVAPLADDVVVRAGTEQALIGRGSGLTVSLDVPVEENAVASAAKEEIGLLLDPKQWSELRNGVTRDRERALLGDVADAARMRKSQARLALARFYLANGLAPEGAGPLDAMLKEDAATRDQREPLFLKGVIATQLHRSPEAIAAFSVPKLKDDPEAGLWRALSQQRLGRNDQALAGFRRGEGILATYPPDLQALFRTAFARAALDRQDLTVAEREIDLLDDMPRDLVERSRLALLRAVLDDESGRPDAAMAAYRSLFDANTRPVAAEAQLRAVRLANTEKRADMTAEEMLARLETVSVIWRGGALEIESLAELSRVYAGLGRWRDAFLTARRASEIFPDDPLTRRMHDETAERFADLFTNGASPDLPRIEALALFYDFREFLPIGRRGDEITRHLAERLVDLDLLDQAAEILDHQIQKRLTGAARSTLAAKLAMIRLMNAKPAEALQALHSTRLVDLPQDVKRARLLLEAKALSDLSRTDQALEMLEFERGPEVDRLRADVNWAGRRWREAGEAHERLLGERWRGTEPLDEAAVADVMRAAVAYVMAQETLALDRLRGKFAAKMAQGPDARTFAFLTGVGRGDPGAIRDAARAAVGAASFSDFLKAYHERYPEYSTRVRQPLPPAQPGQPAGPAAEAPPAAPSPSRG